MYMYTLGEYCIIIYYASTEAQPYEGYAKADCVCVCVCINSSCNCSTVAIRQKLTASIGF